LSQSKTTPINSKDVLSISQKNINKIFYGVKKSVPKYHQSITNLQQEYFQAFENMMDFSITLQKEFVTKEDIVSDVPSTTLKIINDTTEEFIKIFSIQNQIVLASIDATQQNIQTFNDNIKSFVKLNKNILQSCISIFPTKNN
jgi:hypothetical protein